MVLHVPFGCSFALCDGLVSGINGTFFLFAMVFVGGLANAFIHFTIVLLVVLLMFSSFLQWSCWCLLLLCSGFDGAFANVLFLFAMVLLVLFLMPSLFLWCFSYSIHHILIFFIPFFLFYLSSFSYLLCLVHSILHVLFTMLPSSYSQPSHLLLILLLPHPPPSFICITS